VSPVQAARQAEAARKVEVVRAWLQERSWAGAVIRSQAGFAWLTAGGHSHVSVGEVSGVAAILVTATGAYLLTPTIERARLLDEEVGGLGFEVVEFPWYEPLTVDGLSDPARTPSDAEDAGLTALRYTLEGDEVERFRRLGADAAHAVEDACRATRPGDRELDVAAKVAGGAVARDIVPLVNLVAADERIDRYRHPVPTANRVARRLMVALTGRRHGLHASLTRMVAFGPPEDGIAERHAAVRRVDARYLGRSRPGATLGAVLDAGIDQYAAEGYPGEWKRHHQGGLTGYAGREIFATPGQRHSLDDGQALAWNPSITGVKSEDTVVVTAAGCPEVLTRTPDWPREGPEGLERPLMLKGAT
jgi:Xaa-Pro dipeptidase